MKKLRILFAVLSILGVSGAVFATTPQTVYAADVFSEVCDGSRTDTAVSPEESSVCKDKTNTSNPVVGPDGVILRVSSIIAAIAGVVAVVMVIMGGAGMITSGGDAAAVKTARSRVVHALIGLVIIVLAQGIVSLVVGKLLA